MVNLINLLSKIWDRDNSTKKKRKKKKVEGLITKFQMMNLKKKSIFNKKNCFVERQLWKNNKVKYSIIKQFKTQTIQTKHGIKMKEKN